MSLNGDGAESQASGNLTQSPRVEISFPALVFSQGSVYAISSLDAITTCTRLGFKKGFFKEIALVDSQQSKFRVVSAQKLRTVVSSVRHIFEWLTGNPRWQVVLRFDRDSSKVPLDEVKQLILDSFRKQKDSWEGMVDFEEFRDSIDSAATFEEIISAFREFNLA